LINYSFELLRSTVNTYGKIAFELKTFMSDFARREKIIKGVPGLQMFGYTFDALFGVIKEGIDAKYFKPAFSKESILIILSSFIDGYFMNYTVKKCYQMNIPQTFDFEKNDLPKALASSILYLLKNKTSPDLS